MSPKHNLGFMLHKLGAMMEKQSDAVLFEQFGLGFSQFKIMMALEHHQGGQQKEIAQFLGQTEASISRQIKLLEEADFISVGEQPENRKKHVITLTARGKQVSSDAMRALNTFYTPILDTMTQPEQMSVLSSLGKVYDIMNIYCEAKQKKGA